MFKSFFVVILLLVLCSVLNAEVVNTYSFLEKTPRREIGQNEQLYSSDWSIQLHDGQATDFLKEMGFEITGKVGNLKNVYSLRHTETYARHATRGDKERRTPSLHITSLLHSHPSVKNAEQLVLRKHKLYSFADPLFADQWHLVNTGQFSGSRGNDINVQAVWDAGYNGTGILISVVDDGYQYTHPELSPRYVPSSSFDFIRNTADPIPGASNFHGTAVAGAAIAANNAICGVGVAFGASGAGVRLVTGENLITDTQQSNALSYSYQNVDIYSNSWGPTHSTEVAGLGSRTVQALAQNVNRGRGGLGNIYVFAAGNGGDVDDNANMNGAANSRYVIAVAAVDNNGQWIYYSEQGANLLVAAPSLGTNSQAGIRTSDIMGPGGYDPSNCATGFSGTSASTPIVSGVIALMLEANPNLGWRDVQYILASTARQSDPTDTEWKINGAGFHISHKFGFGTVDALAAVNAAIGHTNLPAETRANVVQNFNSITIPDNAPTGGLTETINMPNNLTIERVEINVVINHQTSGDLRIVVTSPEGTESVLAWRHDDFSALQINGEIYQLGFATYGPLLPFTPIQATFVFTAVSSCNVIANCSGVRNNFAYIGVSSIQRGCVQPLTLAAQSCGALATVIYGDDSSLGDTIYRLSGDANSSVTIPTVYVTYADASQLRLNNKRASLYQYKASVNNYNTGWTFSTTRCLGENALGDWKIYIADERALNTGRLTSVSITAYGVANSSSPTQTSSSTSASISSTSSVSASTSSAPSRTTSGNNFNSSASVASASIALLLIAFVLVALY